MCAHLHSIHKKLRCKHIETHPIRKPKTLLSTCHDVKRGNTKNYVTTENAAETIKPFYRRNLNYSADEINVLVEWEICDMQEDEDAAFPMRKSQWDTRYEEWKTAILDAHQDGDNAEHETTADNNRLLISNVFLINEIFLNSWNRMFLIVFTALTAFIHWVVNEKGFRNE